jgi:hypothetical protein
MFCPFCGKQRISEASRFCSGCGFPLDGVAELIARGGVAERSSVTGDSARKRGIKQGAWVMLVGCFLIVPLLALLVGALDINPFLLPIAAVLSFMGGLLRIIYAFMYESSEPGSGSVVGFAIPKNEIGSGARSALPPQSSVPVSDFQMPSAGSWRDSEDLARQSVTDSTTKLLEKERERP